MLRTTASPSCLSESLIHAIAFSDLGVSNFIQFLPDTDVDHFVSHT